jgi:hypothetical protein
MSTKHELTVTRGSTTVTARVWFDDSPHDSTEHGWMAEYFSGGELITDSQKVDHDDMPTHPDAELKAINLARDHARHLAANRESGV